MRHVINLAAELLPDGWEYSRGLTHRWDFDTMSWVFTREGVESMRIPGDHPHLADADATEMTVHRNGLQWSRRLTELHPSDNPAYYRVFVWVSGSFVESGNQVEVVR